MVLAAYERAQPFAESAPDRSKNFVHAKRGCRAGKDGNLVRTGLYFAPHKNLT
jgi:hypothetical protein